MIKIIKKGTKKNQECDFCGCIFSYEEEDIITETFITKNYGEETFNKVKDVIHCPQCKKEIILKGTK